MAEKDRAKIVQLLADFTRAESLQRTAPAHSLTLDLESCELIVHDGITAGGVCRIGMPGAGGGLATQLAPGALRVCGGTNILTGDGAPGSELCIDLGQLSNAEALEIGQALVGEPTAVQVVYDSIIPLLQSVDVSYTNNGMTNVMEALDDLFTQFGLLGIVNVNAPLTGIGSIADPISLDPQDLSNLVPVLTDNVSLGGDGTAGNPLAIINVNTDVTIDGQGTVANPLSVNAGQLTGLIPTLTDVTITGDGTVVGGALGVNIAYLHNKVEVDTDATLTGVGTAANPLSVVPQAAQTIYTDATIDGDGLVATPLGVHAGNTVNDIIADNPVLNTLALAISPLVAHSVATGGSISGDGSLGSPLAVVAETVAVATDASITGDGTTANPLSVANPGLTAIVSDATLTGDGTAGTPLSVDGASLTNIPYAALTGVPAVVGEANTASNVGIGEGIFSAKVGVDFQLKNITGSDGVVASSNATDVDLAVNIASLTSAQLQALAAAIVADATAAQTMYSSVHGKLTDFTAGVLSFDCNGDGNPLT